MEIYTVIIPTCRRWEKLKKCIYNICNCKPKPREILIHIDAADAETVSEIRKEGYKNVRWQLSQENIGPGGGRNWLIKNAKTEYLLGLDDDSWPVDVDFFDKAVKLMDQNPQAAVVTLREIRRYDKATDYQNSIQHGLVKVSCFQNGACLIRRSAFLEIGGFVPLRYAYGMEEADVALQLMDKGWDILYCNDLKVYHDTDLIHQASREINAAHITNTALLAFLRYPVWFWPLGFLQTINRVRYAIGQKRYAGIWQGLIGIPATCYKYRKYREVIKAGTIIKSRSLARAKCKPMLKECS